MMIPQGIQDKNFYALITGALNMNGYANIPDYLRTAPDYWFNDEIWRELFPLEPYENPTRAFEQKIGNTYVPVMATYLSEDAETPLISNEGFEKKTGEIPRMGNGYLFTAKSYDDARKLERIAGTNAALSKVYQNFFLDNRKLISGIHTQRSFTALQVESKGFYVTTKANNVGGIENFQINMNPLASNKKKAGGFGKRGTKFAWTDEKANPLGDLQDMFEYAWTNQILPADPEECVYRMNMTEWNLLLNHASTRATIGLWKAGYLVSADNVSKVPITDGDVNSYLASLRLPAISVDKTFGYTQKVNKETQNIEKAPLAAFADNTVVLRRKGTVGNFQWSRVSNIFETSSSPVYYTDNNSIAIQQDIYSTQSGIKFSASSLCVPVPNAIESILYLNTAEAAS